MFISVYNYTLQEAKGPTVVHHEVEPSRARCEKLQFGEIIHLTFFYLKLYHCLMQVSTPS